MVETELQTEDTRIQRNLIISRKIREKERGLLGSRGSEGGLCRS